ncbi:MAG: hypothetical protein FJ265_19900, partial [Planctomycetes bacterium]|nr:hypothetical protein [Planctomycetota bacterium]
MKEHHDPRLEALAEAVVFAHEHPVADDGSGQLPSLEYAAVLATAALATMPAATAEAPPRALAVRLAAAGLAFCAERRQRAAAAAPDRPGLALVRRGPTPATWFFAALAACLAVWLAIAYGGAPAAPRVLDKQGLVAADPGLVRLPWKAGPSPRAGAVAGEVVWSQQRQLGFLSFRGLPPCDAEHRFQLWIVDGTRGGEPVDGGLFAVGDAGAETVVPVQAKLPIGRAAA